MKHFDPLHLLIYQVRQKMNTNGGLTEQKLRSHHQPIWYKEMFGQIKLFEMINQKFLGPRKKISSIA